MKTYLCCSGAEPESFLLYLPKNLEHCPLLLLKFLIYQIENSIFKPKLAQCHPLRNQGNTSISPQRGKSSISSKETKEKESSVLK